MRRASVWILGAIALLSTTVVAGPAIAATVEATVDTVCDTTPTSGPAPRQPYLGRDAAAVVARNPMYRFGENPYVYTLFVPDGLPDGPVPLIIGLHGLGHSARNFEEKGLMELATREGLIVALPSGARSWYATEDSVDVKFIRDVVADVRAERCIDGRRIWAMGASNGGFMALRLACDAADLFAAISVHAATPADGTYPFGGPCRANDAQAPGGETIPIRFSHGAMDRTVGYGVGRSNLRGWVDRYRCDTKPIETLPTEFGPTEVYGNCHRADIEAREAGTGVPFELQFWTLDNHEHLYPDGCGGTGECDAPGSEFPTADEVNNAMLAFLARHTRSTPAAEQGEPDASALPLRDPVRHATWVAALPDHGPRADVSLVGDDGTPIGTADALRKRVVRVEYAVYAPDGYPDEVFDNNPQCPSTKPGSRKIRIVGRPITLRITDADGTLEYVAATAEQPGTGLAVATFAVERPTSGSVVLEATVHQDRVANAVLCTTRDARFQETIGRGRGCRAGGHQRATARRCDGTP